MSRAEQAQAKAAVLVFLAAILEVSAVVDTFMQIIASDRSGDAWFVIPGRPSEERVHALS